MSKKALIITLVPSALGLRSSSGSSPTPSPTRRSSTATASTPCESSFTTLTSLNPSTASKDTVQSDIDAIQSDWSTVKSDASNLSDANQQALDSAWDSFQSSVSDLTGGSGSTEDVQNAAKGLESAVQANADTYDCGITSTTTTTSS